MTINGDGGVVVGDGERGMGLWEQDQEMGDGGGLWRHEGMGKWW